MSYKYSSGSVRRGDIYYEDDREGQPTYIDFEQDTITLRPSGSQILHATSYAIGIGTTSPDPDELLTIDGVSGDHEANIQFREDGANRAKIGVNDSDNLVFHNQTVNKHIVFKVNDQSVTREGLRIDGAVPEVVVNEGAESLVDFRVESDNNTHMLFVDGANDKVGINTDAPDYTLDVAGDIGVNQYIYHNGDGNTWINFTDNRIRLNAGGNNFIDCEDPGSAPHKVRINNGGNNIDFVIKDNSNNVYFTADASTARIGIGTDTPDHTLSVSGNISASVNISASAFYGDGSNLTGIAGGGSPAGADTQIQFNDGGSNFGASSNLTYDDTTLKVSTTGLNPIFSLEATNDASDASPIFTLKRNSASPADADYLGQLKFLGENDADQEVTYAKITGKISDASDGTEDGILEFANIKAGSQTVTARLRSDSLQLLNSTGLTVDGDAGFGTTSPLVKLDVHHNPTSLANDTGGGEVVTFGTGTLTAGKLYFLNSSGVWTETDADAISTSDGLLGIALGSSPSSDGVLLRGFFDAHSYLSNFVSGLPVYISTTAGAMDTTLPSGTGDIVRCIGYCTNTSAVIYFNPESTTLELS